MKDPSKLRQRAAFAVLFLSGAQFLIGGSFAARRDAWISLLLTLCGTFAVSLLAARLHRRFPGKDLFDLLPLFPRVPAGIITAGLIVYCADQCAAVLRGYAGFTRIVSLPATPIPLLLLLSCAVVYVFLRRKDGVLFRFSFMAFLPIIAAVLFLFAVQSPSFRWERLLPMADQNGRAITAGAWQGFVYPFGNLFLLIGILPAQTPPKTARRFYAATVGLSGVLSLLILFQCLLSLGGDLSARLFYPYDFAVSLISIGDFMTRVEAFAALLFYLTVIVRCVWYAKAALRGLSRLVPVEREKMALPFTVFLFAYSCVVFRRTEEVFSYLSALKYVAPVFQVLLPLALWFCAEAQCRRKTDKKSPLSL